MKTKPYVGKRRSNGALVPFRTTPPPEDHQVYGVMFSMVTGPFKTMRGARYFAKHSTNNPHCQSVKEAETLALDEELERAVIEALIAQPTTRETIDALNKQVANQAKEIAELRKEVAKWRLR